MKSEVMFSSNSEEWATPQKFFDELNKEFNFELDVCATQQNAKCKRFYTKSNDSLKHEWKGRCFMNPPYGRAIRKWVEKAVDSVRKRGGGVRLLYASYRQEQIRAGGMILLFQMQQKSDLSAVVLNSMMGKTRLPSLLPW